MGIAKAIITSALKSAKQTFYKRDRIKGNSQRKYFSIQAHPDDEILKAGIDGRIIKYSQDPTFVTLTNGNQNTDLDRMAELQNAFGLLGYEKKVTCLMNEKDILNYVCTEQGASTFVQQENIDLVTEGLRERISWLEQAIESSGANTIFTTDYAGGHFVHDITQMVAVVAARRVAKGRELEIYEFPQYFMSLNTDKDVPPSEVQKLISRVIDAERDIEGIRKEIEFLSGQTITGGLDLSRFVKYSVGEFVNGQTQDQYLTDPGIGMYDGTIHLTLPEMVKKIRIKQLHKSQKSSLKRMLTHGTAFGDFSEEHLRLVDSNRDYTQPPKTNTLLYQVVPWRPHADFQTFRRIYEGIMAKE